MDAFTEAFFAIDVDHSETITTDELRIYMKKNDMDPVFIQRWQEIFDPDNTGIITLNNFCDVLGLEVNQLREKYNIPVKNGEPVKLEYEEISVDLPEDLKEKVIEYAAEGLKLHTTDDREFVKWFKRRMDENHGRLWHCMIVRGQYFSFYSYQPGHSFCFKVGNRIFILFKTPCA